MENFTLSNDWKFFEMSKMHFEKVIKADERLAELNQRKRERQPASPAQSTPATEPLVVIDADFVSEINKELLIQRMIIHEDGIRTVVLAAMCLEAIINLYGVMQKSSKHYDKYLDKLSHKQKWVVVPKYFTAEEFPTDGQAFEALGKLLTFRNEIVHSKPTNVDITGKDGLGAVNDEISEQDQTYTRNTRNAMKALLLCTGELHRISPDFRPLHYYQPSHLDEYEELANAAGL